MNRFIWNSDWWEKPKHQWCVYNCGNIATRIDGSCGCKDISIVGNRIEVPAFEVVANPTVRWNDIGRRRFNALDRVQERMREALDIQANAAHTRLLNYVAGMEDAER